MKIGKLINHNITIKPSMNMGFIVHIGCGCFVAADKATLIAELNEYLSDPEKYEKLYGECGNEVTEVAGSSGNARTPRPERRLGEATVSEASPDSEAPA